MDKAFVQHAEHDVHRHDRRHDQPDGVTQRGLERQGAALELGLNISREAYRFFRRLNGLHRFTQRVIVRHVKGDGGGRELIQMVNRQRGIAFFHRGDSAQRHNAAVFAGQAHRVQPRQAGRVVGVVLQHHAILVRLGVDGGDQTLTEGVVQSVIHVRHGDAQTAGGVAVDVHVRRQPFVLPVAADVGELRQGFEFIHQLRHPGAERVQRGGLQRELVLRAADLGIDGQILNRLQVKLNARHAGDGALQPLNDGVDAIVALIQRLKVDLQTRAVERRVGAVHADVSGQALYRRILHDDVRYLLLALRHIGKRDRLWGLKRALNNAVVLDREEAFRNENPQHHAERQRAERHAERGPRVVEDFRQHATVGGNNALEHALGGAREAVLLAQRRVAQHAGAHHRRQGQRHHGGDQNGDRQRHGKLTEQTPDDIAHKQQRDQHRNQREGQRDNGKADFPCAFQRGGQRFFTFLDIARDILDDDESVVHHEPGGDGERHQRQVVDRKIEEHHHRKGADQRERYGDGGNNGRRNVAQEQINDHHHQRNRQHQLELGVGDRRANVGGTVGKHLHADRLRQAFDQLRQHGADAVGGFDDVCARLALHVHHDRLLPVGPGSQPAVFRALFYGRHVAQTHRRAVLVGDNQLTIFVGGLHLVVRRERDGAGWAVQRALRRVDVGIADGAADGFAGEPQRGDGLRVKLDAHRRALSARQGDEADAGDLRNFLRHARFDHVFDLGHWHGGGGDGQRHDRRIRRVHLAVDRRVRQV